jgi:tetratricopeptide (TPR) repeat protein
MSAEPRRRRAALLSAGLALLVLTACQRADPLDEVRQLHAAGRPAASLEPLRALLEERPDDPEVLYLYGVALEAAGRPSLWALEKAMLHPDWLVPAGLRRASSALRLGSHDAAVAAATRVLEAEPDNLAALVLRARARVESRRAYEEGLEDAERVLEQEPDSLDALVSKTVALLGLERAEEAEEAIEQLEERFREADLGPELTARYCVARVEFAKERGDLALAEERLDRCLAEHPAATIGVSEAVDFFDSLGRPDRSIEVLQQALAEAPETIEFRTGLAQRLQQVGREEEAEALLVEASEAEVPAQAMLGWVALAEYRIAAGRYEEGATALEQAVAIGEDPELLFLYAETLISAGRFDDALVVAERIGLPVYAALLRGRVLHGQGKPAQALAAFDEGLTLWPNNAVARYYAARAAEDAGDFDRAVEEYRYALRSDPNAADTRWRLAKLLLAEGALEPAFNALMHAWSREPGGPELELMAIGIAARMGGRPGFLQSRLRSLRNPAALRARALAAGVRGLGERRGADAAFQLVAAEAVDLHRPVNLPVLEALAALLLAEERAEQALEGADAAVEAHPEFAPFHALRGAALVALGRTEEARAAYERSLQQMPSEARALAGLARLARDAGDGEAALAGFQAAAAADPEDVASRLAAAELLLAADRTEEARPLLEQALAREPYDPAVLRPLARLELAADPDSARGRALALRAERFSEEG